MHKLAVRVVLCFSALCFPLMAQAQFAPKKGDFFFYDASYDGLVVPNDAYQTRGFSNGHNFSMTGDYVFSRSHWSVGYGLGIGSHNIYSNIYVRSDANGNQLISLYDPDTTNLKETKVNFKYVDLPFELRYRSALDKKGRYWRVYLGTKVGYRYAFYSEIRKGNNHIKDLNSSHIKNWRWVGYLRVGHGYFNATFQYNFLPLWEIPNDTESLNGARMWSAGVSLSL